MHFLGHNLWENSTQTQLQGGTEAILDDNPRRVTFLQEIVEFFWRGISAHAQRCDLRLT
jgi:hypothetical protein